MEQEKIGRFIASLRKEKKLTQMQLAEKLNITDRAVSKWERGKSMPDISIMIELCSILGISVNELLIGERIEKEEMINATDINLVKALTVVEKREKLLKKNTKIICAVSAIIVIIIFIGYLIYNNAEIILDYNSTLVSCNIEDRTLVYKEYRRIAGTPYKIIDDKDNNITYIFFQSKDFFKNYIRNYNDIYELIGYASISENDNYSYIKMDLDEDIDLENNKIQIYYTKTNMSFNKEYKLKDLSKLLKNATLILEYN